MKILHRTCPVCKCEFDRPATGGHLIQAFCSKLCAGAKRHSASVAEKKTRRQICEQCGMEFCPPENGRRFCSRRCSGIHRQRVSPTVAKWHEVRCRECGVEFSALAANTWFCGIACRLKGQKRRMPYHRLRERYGLTPEQYAAMRSSQGNVCAICAEPLSEGLKSHVDHCHRTGAVRGILCQSCNHGIGNFRDDPERLRAAVKYLEGVAH
jgi:Recombination endonuclease VII